MFINCPYCRALVATDPVTDLPPTHCPHCDSLLRRDPDETADAAADEPPPLTISDLLSLPADAARTERATPAADTASQTAAAPASADSIEADAVAAAEVVEAVEAVEAVETAGGEATATAGDMPPAPPRPRALRGLPSFVRGAGRTPGTARDRWVPAAVVGLALLLALQLLLADRARLAGDARWRPLLQALCSVLRCELPPWREPGAFVLLQRDVRQHPSLPGALRVSATFRNDARWPQPWPRLQLALSDANGRVAGERTFRAEEYLGGAPTQPELASGESATVAMDILEPAPGIVGYDFSFR